jgi:DNA-binding NarL/FixJ family response regulator
MTGVRVTPREREIPALLVSGRTYGEIARELVISEKTVSPHVSNLLAKTGTSNRVELAGNADRSHLTTG